MSHFTVFNNPLLFTQISIIKKNSRNKIYKILSFTVFLEYIEFNKQILFIKSIIFKKNNIRGYITQPIYEKKTDN